LLRHARQVDTPFSYSLYSNLRIFRFPEKLECRLRIQKWIPCFAAGGHRHGDCRAHAGTFLRSGKKVRNPVKDMPYESGIVPTGDARHRVSVKFYMVGMLFILFDIEAIFLYPWAVSVVSVGRAVTPAAAFGGPQFCEPEIQ